MMFERTSRWLPRFGLKSLFAAVLVIAVYLGSWPWLQERAEVDIRQASFKNYIAEWKQDNPDSTNLIQWLHPDFWPRPSAVAPYVLAIDEQSFLSPTRKRSYYLWLFGARVRLHQVDVEIDIRLPPGAGGGL